MIAVTGGIEVASDALLPKIQKGISVPNVIKVLQAFRGAGVLCHAYLIYGFPGETLQDTIDSLETLRQLFRADLLQSGVFHTFSLTAHAPIARAPELYGIRIKATPFGGFSRYDLPYESVTVPAPDPEVFQILDKALNAFVHGKYLDAGDIRAWFKGREAPVTTIEPDLVARTLLLPHPVKPEGSRLCWLGGVPRWSAGLLEVSCASGEIYAGLAPQSLAENLARCHPASWTGGVPPRPSDFASIDWCESLRARGLVQI
jgi:hypothetical protein